MKKSNITIGITSGDIAGIGPEVIFKALNHKNLNSNAKFVIFGDKKIYSKFSNKNINDKLDISFSYELFPDISTRIKGLSFKNSDIGNMNSIFASYAIKWIDEAVLAFKRKKIDALVTAPINKEGCKKAGFKFNGHTDYLAKHFNNPKHNMTFYSKDLKVILVSHHVSLINAIKKLNSCKIIDTICLGNDFMKKLGIKNPEIYVSGLNPHASENGNFGFEEKRIISPAIKYVQKQNINLSGPYPPDTVFNKAYKNKNALVVSMTHDLGLIPFKLVAFKTGVNVTIGLPIIRTSPDHGTGYDIAWQRRANELSMLEAINLSIKLVLKNC